MGIFDVLAPLLHAADTGLSVLVPPVGRLAIWAVIGGVVSMGLYWLLSPQARISELKVQIAEVRRMISNYEGDFDGVHPLLARSIGLSLRQVVLMLVPAVAASIPLLFLLASLASSYSYSHPRVGDNVEVRVSSERTSTHWYPSEVGTPIEDGWRVIWPENGGGALLLDEEENPLLSLPLKAAVPVIRKAVWWNAFFGNPLGYLPTHTDVDQIEIELQRRSYLSFGPSWMGRWEFIFFTFLVLSSLAIKFAFRIH